MTADPLAAYRPTDVFFADSERAILGSGAVRTWTTGSPDALADEVAQALAEAGPAIALGAFPFDTGAAAALTIPETVRTGTRPRPSGPVDTGEVIHFNPVPEPEKHLAAVADLTARIEDGRLDKAVLARVLDLECREPVDVGAVLRNLVAGNPAAYSFAVPLPHHAVLAGASPELLVSKSGGEVRSHPLAGSARRSPDPVRDKENAARLAASAKNRAEHALVVEAVADGLRPFCRELTVPAEPELVATPTMWHLGTQVRGTLHDREVSSLRLAAALHPTPAVCGTPSVAAREAIGDLEPFDRGFYAGMAGWVDATGDGAWAVAIRCAEVAGQAMRLYAGGGIVAGSDPAAELDETSAKFQTLLRAMGLEMAG
ncbi:isochorismate synthase [Amycolatopsis endophytica]|uniref:isochorismate synthase n=1 Tax=Amycolatopsis endophytica TaxID=860233 RepID=A0A853BCM4_9PSEU|nr:isochorismate synthase [Amycolatopsis endophytica]NYI92535.1 isochorismate synthase [Amycolatopsis endophytica]